MTSVCFLREGLVACGLLLPFLGNAIAAQSTPPPPCAVTFAQSSGHTGPYVAAEPSRLLYERVYDDQLLVTLRERHFRRATSIEIVGRGAESLVVLVRFPGGYRTAVRVPRYGRDDRSHSYQRELGYFRYARSVDSAGAAYLAVPRRFHYDEVAQLPMLFLEYAPEGSLDGHLDRWGARRAVFDPDSVLDLWRQMALAVRALHRAGIVHRDVKPANFLVAERGRLLLTDLGLAARVGKQVSGLEGLMSGTLSHMSDNQLGRGNAAFADDLYALKITFREVLSGMTVWHLDPRVPENHVLLRPIDEFGTYPILYALPDPVAERVPERLRRIAESDFENVDKLLASLQP